MLVNVSKHIKIPSQKMEPQEPRLFCLYLNQDDPKKNTVVKLAKFGVVKMGKKLQRFPKKAIILDPFSEKEISQNDHISIAKYGIIVIDCSWEQIDTIFTHKFQTGRRLPHLLAANTVNYGKWDKLSSAEALAAALYYAGFPQKAYNLLEKFKWGITFWEINRNFLPKYE